MTSLEILREIQRRDPDGRLLPPTPEEREAFKQWVVANYSIVAWLSYMRGGWERTPEV